MSCTEHKLHIEARLKILCKKTFDIRLYSGTHETVSLILLLLEVLLAQQAHKMKTIKLTLPLFIEQINLNIKESNFNQAI